MMQSTLAGMKGLTVDWTPIQNGCGVSFSSDPVFTAFLGNSTLHCADPNMNLIYDSLAVFA
jgi:hypothetical protein